MERYILDTNLFFNMEGGLGMGKATEEVVVAFTKAIRSAKHNRQVELYMPPRIVDEFLSFFENKSQGFIKDFFSTITVQSPNLHATHLSAAIVWQIIDDVRNRNYRGQTIAEEEIIQAAKLTLQQGSSDKKQFEMALGPVVKRFRLRYRQATRFGFLDSVADLELIILAKEVDGFLVSTDEGVLRWGRVFGVKEISAPVFGKKMTE